jgi:hypothetical protein
MSELVRIAHRTEITKRWEKLRFINNDKEFDLVVFLFELHELKGAIPGLKTHWRRLRAIFARGTRARARTLGDLVTGGWLDWSFGTGAFVRDLYKLINLFAKFNGKWEKFISGMGREQGTAHLLDLSGVLPLPIGLGQVTPYVVHLFGGEWQIRTKWSLPRVNAHEPYSSLSAQYRYYSSGMTGMFGKAKFAMQKFGVIPIDPTIPWNLIPLTFVYDWALPIGDRLDRMRIDLFDLNVVVDGAGYGTRITLQRDFEIRSLKPGPGNPGLWQQVGYEKLRQYGRKVIEPRQVSDKPIQFAGVTLSKAASAASLVWVLSGYGGKTQRK